MITDLVGRPRVPRVPVFAGQVYESREKKERGRRVTVLVLERRHAVCQNADGSPARIRIDRLRSRWRLVLC